MYIDYSQEVEDKLLETVIRHSKKSKNEDFPTRLYQVISEAEASGQEHIVSWQPHGRCFIFHDKHKFEQEILPLWFQTSKFPSFQRQLRMYGFCRINGGRDKGGYYHSLFLRGKPFLCCRIMRVRMRQPPSSEIDFYNMSFLPETKAREQISALEDFTTTIMGSSMTHDRTLIEKQSTKSAKDDNECKQMLAYCCYSNPLTIGEGGCKSLSLSGEDRIPSQNNIEENKERRPHLVKVKTSSSTDRFACNNEENGMEEEKYSFMTYLTMYGGTDRSQLMLPLDSEIDVFDD